MVTSTAYPHDPLIEIGSNIWFVHGRMRMGPGMMINRNMVVVREGADLTLINPMRLTTEGEQALEQLGSVEHAIRLGPAHGVDDAYTVDRFNTRFHCLGTDADYPTPDPHSVIAEDGDLPVSDASLFVFRETVRPEGCILLARGKGLLVSCDSIQNWESASNCSWLATGVTYAMGFMRRANIGPPWRKFMTPKGGSLRPDFDRLLELQFDALVGAHGQPLLAGAREALRETVEDVLR
jgi:hypothetical protein